ncbi:hypothetical protein ACHAP8_004799 [Fusarium lateritium]
MAHTTGVTPLYQVHKPPFTIETPGYEKKPGETIPRRHPQARHGLVERPADDVHTVFDIVRRSARLYPDHRAVGWRKLIKLHKETTQVEKKVDAYDSLGQSGLEHSLLQSQAEVIYIDPYLLKTATEPLKKSKVHTVIVNESSIFGGLEMLEAFRAENPKLKVVNFTELCELGKSTPIEPVFPKPDDLYCVMYTSGSGGVPKGVRIAHKNLVAGVAGLYTCVADCVTQNDVLLAYLPLAHVLEMALENLAMFFGGTVGYGHPRTISDTSVRNCEGDMRALKPTVMPGVPQVYEMIRKGIMTRLNSSVLLKILFWRAFAYKSFMVKHNLPGALLLDGIVFGKIREMTGGKIRFLFNGGSPISLSTKHFLSMVLAPMFTGYGLTETCAVGALGSPLEFTLHSIGTVPASAEIKLVSVPEFGYSADADTPQGEILIKGPAVMMGYYENEEETKKSFTEDGWFKTGDVGEFDSDGHLRIIDRIKNIVKLLSGEYVALEKLDSIYRGAQGVMNAMIYADSLHARPIAVVMPNETVLAGIAKDMGVDEHSIYTDKKVRQALLKDLQATGRRAGLSSMEIVADVVITPEEWTPATGLVTATQKLNRRAINSRYKTEIDRALEQA